MKLRKFWSIGGAGRGRSPLGPALGNTAPYLIDILTDISHIYMEGSPSQNKTHQGQIYQYCRFDLFREKSRWDVILSVTIHHQCEPVEFTWHLIAHNKWSDSPMCCKPFPKSLLFRTLFHPNYDLHVTRKKVREYTHKRRLKWTWVRKRNCANRWIPKELVMILSLRACNSLVFPDLVFGFSLR